MYSNIAMYSRNAIDLRPRTADRDRRSLRRARRVARAETLRLQLRALLGRLFRFGLFAAVLAFAGRHRDLLGLGRRAGDERDVDLVFVLARDEDGRVRRQRAAED